MQNATVREYTRRCNTVENSYRSVKPSYLRLRDRGNYKEGAACPITKVSNCSHFHIPLFFCSLLSQLSSMRFFSLFDTFSFLPRDRGNYKKVPLVRSPKQVIVLIFIFLECFCSLLSQPCSITDFFLFLIPFLILEIYVCVQRRVTIPQGQEHVLSAQRS